MRRERNESRILKRLWQALCESYNAGSPTRRSNRRVPELSRQLIRSSGTNSCCPGRAREGRHQKTSRMRFAETLAILWLLRHNFTHKSGVSTGSETMKLNLLNVPWRRRDVGAFGRGSSIRQAFLSETAEDINHGRERDSATSSRRSTEPLFVDPVNMAQELANLFRLPLQSAGTTPAPSSSSPARRGRPHSTNPGPISCPTKMLRLSDSAANT